MVERFADRVTESSATPHIVDPTGALGGYWTDPPGVLVRFIRPARGTSEMARWLANEGLQLLLARFPGEHRLRLILDMREMVGRAAMARSVLLEASKHSVGRIEHIVLLPSLHMGTAYRTVIEGSAAALRLIGYHVDIETDLHRVLDTHGIRLQSVSTLRAIPRAHERRP